jgi:hypothetical protein
VRLHLNIRLIHKERVRRYDYIRVPKYVDLSKSIRRCLIRVSPNIQKRTN